MDYQRAMTRAYNDYAKGKGSPQFIVMFVGQAIWDYFNEHVVANTRWVEGEYKVPEPRWVAFKSAQMYLNNRLDPEEYQFFTQVHKGRCSEPQANGTGYGG